MEIEGRGAPTTAALVERYLEDWSDDMGPAGAVPAQEGAWRVRSVLLLLDQGFPEHLIHQVLWCSEKEARAMVDSIRRHFPEADSMRAFLEAKSGKTSSPEQPGEDDSSLSLDEDVEQALNMLEYWTDHWLQEYQGKEPPG